ncbi:MAG: hypothetical protein NTX95_09815 [Actinobacteria bacterium]|nr:hypothetical protein [Actinomycetota bacterium]
MDTIVKRPAGVGNAGAPTATRYCRTTFALPLNGAYSESTRDGFDTTITYPSFSRVACDWTGTSGTTSCSARTEKMPVARLTCSTITARSGALPALPSLSTGLVRLNSHFASLPFVLAILITRSTAVWSLVSLYVVVTGVLPPDVRTTASFTAV